MSSVATDAAGTPTAADVARQFVEQYYRILETYRDVAHKFYQDGSFFSRPSSDRKLCLITTMDEIREKIIAMGEVRPTLKSVDAQPSLGGGVFILVRGSLMGTDSVSRDFTQSFFLAPQVNGFYVLNDIFRYDKDDPPEGYQGLPNGAEASLVVEHDALQQPDQHVTESTMTATVKDMEVNEDGVCTYSSNHESLVVEERALSCEVIKEVIESSPSSEVIEKVQSTTPSSEVIERVPNSLLNSEVTDEVLDGDDAMVESSSGKVTQESEKKSYASILKAMKNSTHAPVPAHAPVRPAPPVPPSAPVSSAPVEEDATLPVLATGMDIPTPTSSASESSYTQEAEADVYSIYVKNLPMDATPAQLEDEFKKFGSIKPDGIQIRSNKLQGFCFGFVEFEVASAVQNAIQASPITIGRRQVYIEEKKPTGPRGGNRSGNAPIRGGGFRSDGVRGYSGYGSGRSYGRGDFVKRSDFGGRTGGRGGGSSGRSSFSYQKVYHARSNGGGYGRHPPSATSDES